MATITELFCIPPGESDVFSARFSNLSGGTRPQHLALGLGDGTISINQASSGKQLVLVPAAHHESVKAPSLGLPITALRWRPEGTSEFKVTQATSAKDVLLAAGSDGIIRHIHANSGRILSTIVDEDSQIYACDYRKDAKAFATVGNKKCVKVYDEETRGVLATMSGGTMQHGVTPHDFQRLAITTTSPAGGGQAPRYPPAAEFTATGHNNRVFSVVWHPSEGEGNILASGGWDNTIQIWDLRVGSAVRSIYGPHMAGDGLAFTPDGKYLVSASWRSSNALQVWDWGLGGGTLAVTIPWAESNVDYREMVALAGATTPPLPFEGGSRLYSTSISPSGAWVLTGGSGLNEAKVFSLGEAIKAGAATAAATVALAAAGTAAGAGGAGKSGGGKAAASSSASAASAAAAATAASALPLMATVSGLERGVFAVDWAGEDTFVVAGGDAPTRVFQIKGLVEQQGQGQGQAGRNAGGSGWGGKEGAKAGQGVWGPDGDSLLLDYGASPPPDSPLKPSRRVMRAQRAGMAAGSGHPVPPSPTPSAPAAAADLGSGRGSPEGEPPLVSAILASPTPRKGKGSSALRAITEARDMAASAAAGGGVGGGGGGGGAGAGAGAGAGGKKSLKAATEEEDEDDDEDDVEDEEEGGSTTLSPQGGGFLSRL